MENSKNDSVRDRLLQFIGHIQISTRAFEASCGLSNGFVKNISKGIGAEKMRSILQIYPQLNSDWLLTGEGSMLRPTSIEQKIGDVKYSTLKEVNVIKNGETAVLKERVKFLQQLLEEKERTIKILMERK